MIVERHQKFALQASEEGRHTLEVFVLEIQPVNPHIIIGRIKVEERVRAVVARQHIILGQILDRDSRQAPVDKSILGSRSTRSSRGGRSVP